MKIGIDLEDNTRFVHLLEQPHFLKRIFTPSERQYIESAGHKGACGIFCVKEAFSKALGCGILALDFQAVSVEREPSGKPFLRLSGPYAHLQGEISISHSGNHTTAVCLIL